MRTFSKLEHVRKRAEFELIYKTGTKRSGRLMTLFSLERQAGAARLGIAATRKQMGRAVERNRAKRLVREVFRHARPGGAVDVVVVPRRELLDAPLERIQAEFATLLKKSRTSHA